MEEEKFRTIVRQILIRQILNPYNTAWFAPQFHNLSAKNYDNNYKQLIREEYIQKEYIQKEYIHTKAPPKSEEWVIVGKN